MKRIEFIAPVEAIRGNMSGKQTLLYAENNNPAFDAPDGVQYARNYKPRYIGHRRAKDGLVYFSVKRKAATKIDATSKITMAALGTIQDLKKAFKNNNTTVGPISGPIWGFIVLAYNVGIENREIDPSYSVDKWIDGLLIDMLRYKLQDFTVYTNKTHTQSLTINNPYVYEDISTIAIAQRNFIKFNPVLTILDTPLIVYVNGMPIVADADASPTWSALKSDLAPDNMNYSAQLAPLTAASADGAASWSGKQLYSSAGVAQLGGTALIDGEHYTTFDPS